MNKEFSGYIGHVVKLKDGTSARIIEGIGKPSFPGHKILLRDLDGNEFECYHSDIDHVWDKN